MNQKVQKLFLFTVMAALLMMEVGCGSQTPSQTLYPQQGANTPIIASAGGERVEARMSATGNIIQLNHYQTVDIHGQSVRLHQFAQVTINLINYRNLDVSRDSIVATLSDGVVRVRVQSVSGIQYGIRHISRTTQDTSATEEVINTVFEVTAY